MYHLCSNTLFDNSNYMWHFFFFFILQQAYILLFSLGYHIAKSGDSDRNREENEINQIIILASLCEILKQSASCILMVNKHFVG